jgi:ribosome-associated heat shock protein Hsp15
VGRDERISDEALAPAVQRLDKWLWFARVLKSRTLAAELVERGKVRVNRMRVVKPSHTVREGDVLTISLRGRVLVLKVLAAGARRGPPPEARCLYERVDDRTAQSTGAEAANGRDVVLHKRIRRRQSARRE